MFSLPTENREPATWDKPRSEKPDTRWFHPRFLAFIASELVLMLRSYIWHKRRSLRAGRWAIQLELGNALQTLEYIANDEDVPYDRRRDARKVQRAIISAAEELEIEGDRLDVYDPDTEYEWNSEDTTNTEQEAEA